MSEGLKILILYLIGPIFIGIAYFTNYISDKHTLYLIPLVATWFPFLYIVCEYLWVKQQAGGYLGGETGNGYAYGMFISFSVAIITTVVVGLIYLILFLFKKN